MYDIWNGTICFESISIPVRVRLAAAPISIRLKKLHSCGEPIRQRIFCANCGEITGSETKRGLAVGKGQFVTVTKEELEACRPNSYSLMTVDQCVLPQDVPFELIQSTYYLEPSSGDTLAYSLLLRALAAENKVALTRVTLRRREQLAIIRPMEKCLALQTLFFEGEVRRAPNVEFQDGAAFQSRLSEITALVNCRTKPFEHSSNFDSYDRAIEQLRQEKEEELKRATDQRQAASLAEVSNSRPNVRVLPVPPVREIGSNLAVEVHTAVASANDKPGRYAYVYRNIDQNGVKSERVQILEKSTCNEAELLAVIEAMNAIPPGTLVSIHTNSTYVSGSGTNLARPIPKEGPWMRRYQEGRVAHAKLWKQYAELAASRQVYLLGAKPDLKAGLQSAARKALAERELTFSSRYHQAQNA